MEADGLIQDAPTPRGGTGDARRRYYRITAKDKRVAGAESARLASLVAAAREKHLLARGDA